MIRPVDEIERGYAGDDTECRSQSCSGCPPCYRTQKRYAEPHAEVPKASVAEHRVSYLALGSFGHGLSMRPQSGLWEVLCANTILSSQGPLSP
jgi:hypothetical protein